MSISNFLVTLVVMSVICTGMECSLTYNSKLPGAWWIVQLLIVFPGAHASVDVLILSGSTIYPQDVSVTRYKREVLQNKCKHWG